MPYSAHPSSRYAGASSRVTQTKSSAPPSPVALAPTRLALRRGGSSDARRPPRGRYGKEEVGVVFCGAPMIAAALKEACEKHSKRDSTVFRLHKENF